tara:strand:+ start:106 stop:534 length:429 start_codon:yes stop_codon:yes gene_type:complete
MNHQDLQNDFTLNFTNLFKIITDYDKRFNKAEKTISDYDKRFNKAEKTISDLQNTIADLNSQQLSTHDNSVDSNSDSGSDSDSDSDNDSDNDSDSKNDSGEKYTKEILMKKKIPELKTICKEKNISSNRKNKKELVDSILSI